jgi:hypothetical protein
MALLPTHPIANISKAATCHTERGKINEQRKGVLAIRVDGRGGGPVQSHPSKLGLVGAERIEY